MKEREKLFNELKEASNKIEEENLEVRQPMYLDDFEAKADFDLIMQITSKATTEITRQKLQNKHLAKSHEEVTNVHHQEVETLKNTIQELKGEVKILQEQNLKLKRGDFDSIRKTAAEMTAHEVNELIGRFT